MSSIKNHGHFSDQTTDDRPAVPEGTGGAMAPPDFGRYVNPISTRGADYAHQSQWRPQIFRPSYGPADGKILIFILNNKNQSREKLIQKGSL